MVYKIMAIMTEPLKIFEVIIFMIFVNMMHS